MPFFVLLKIISKVNGKNILNPNPINTKAIPNVIIESATTEIANPIETANVAAINVWLVLFANFPANASEITREITLRADADKQREIILAEAYSEAEEIRGSGDATSASIYASAYGKDREFYKFYRSMAAYQKTFSNKGDVLLVDPDSDFFSYLNNSKQ